MPLNLAEFNKNYQIVKVCGLEEQKHYLESLGFVQDSEVQILTEVMGYYVVLIKGSKVGLEKSLAQRIIVREVM